MKYDTRSLGPRRELGVVEAPPREDAVCELRDVSQSG